MEPKKLEVSPNEGAISITWSDGHVGRYSPLKLRTECPCAMCKGEPGLFGKYYEVERPEVSSAVMAEEILPVGRYGLRIVWSDHHDLGIYTFDYLRNLCECSECKIKKHQ